MIHGSSTKEIRMAVTQLTQTNLDDTINNNDIVVIDFWAPWCGPCQTFKPIFEQAAEKHEDAVFASCNTEEESELAAMFQIQSIPTLVVFRDGIGIFGQPGMLPAEALDELMDKVREVDMEEVRAEVEKQQETAPAEA
jgi:thioredoxin 1